jgi:curved DNA-binding protein CbpA
MKFGAELLKRDLYADLGVTPHASAAEIRAAYRRLARQSHPDLHGCDPEATQRMARINVAARVLADPALRAAYDSARRQSAGATTQAAAPTQWYERRARAGSLDWEPATTYPRTAHGVRLAARMRDRSARFALFVHHLFGTLAPRQQQALIGLCLLTTLVLLAVARPYGFGSRAQRATSVAVSALAP